MAKYTNSSFRTRQERDCFRGLSREELIAVLLRAGVPADHAEEFADDPNAIPTSVRKQVVALPPAPLQRCPCGAEGVDSLHANGKCDECNGVS